MSKSTEKGKCICAYRFLPITVLQLYFCLVCRKPQQYLWVVGLAGLKMHLAENFGSAYHWVNGLPRYWCCQQQQRSRGKPKKRGMTELRNPSGLQYGDAYAMWRCNSISLSSSVAQLMPKDNDSLLPLCKSSETEGIQPAALLCALETSCGGLAVLWVTASLQSPSNIHPVHQTHLLLLPLHHLKSQPVQAKAHQEGLNMAWQIHGEEAKAIHHVLC